ncbi:MAG: hypothetical protein LAP21_23960 [Acidobacteriia bacterium]|nr:hypothetical protein [Terriglobia bacterium]
MSNKDSQSNPEGMLPKDGEHRGHNQETNQKHSDSNQPADPSRRSFMGKAGGLTAMAVAAGMVPLEPLLGGKETQAEASVVPYLSPLRAANSLTYRTNTALAEYIDVGTLPDNGDLARYTDFSAMFSKPLRFDGLGVPNRASFVSFRNALITGRFADFERILVGTPGGGPNSRLNGPQGSLALDLEGLDSHATVIPPSPTTRSAQTAAEQVEHYWGALLRDVPFAQYTANSTVAQAVADLNNMSFIRSAVNNEIAFPVTPQNLFRGQIVPGDGNVMGPFVSQFMLQPASYGAQPLDQKLQVLLPVGAGGSDYMTDPGEYQLVERGGDSGRQLAFDPIPRYIHMGRDLASYTHVDVLFQAYFTAFMIMAGIGVPLNPSNPYVGSNTEKPFGTLGGPDIAGLLGEMASRALKGAWFHKWIVNLRQRPEQYAALLQARLTNTQPVPQASRELHADVLNSAALPIIRSTYGSWLLPQAFPEGSPTHPCYPTGHGTVAGACITALKFFFNGSAKIRPLLVAAGSDVKESTPDGNSLVDYAGADKDNLDINGELVKLAFNVTTGHGIHAGIHFRSSNNWSVLLGEQIGLAVLRDRARSYNEPFTVNITKFDGTTATISNQ